MGRRQALAGLVVLALGCTPPKARAGAKLRVVSISPSTTEAVFAVGAGAALVGRSTYCDYPEEVRRLPAVGGFADPSLEKILALQPTVVLSARGPAGPGLAEALAGRGIEVFFPEVESIPQIEAMLTELGERLDHAAGAAAAVASIEASRRQVAAATAGRKLVRTVFLFDVSPIIAAGPGSFPDGLLREAGGENLIVAGGQYPSLDLERLLALDPEIILDGATDDTVPGAPSRVAALRDARGWRDLRALREGRVRVLSGATVLRPGPRIGEGLSAVARALHGAP